MNALSRFFSRPAGLAGAILLALVVIAALTAPLVAPGDPLAMAGRPLLQPFTDWRFPLGTDRLGRDLTAELLHGARTTLAVGLSAAAAALLIGVVIGTAAGFAGGLVDEALMRLTDAFQAVPNLLLALALVSVAGASLTNVVIAIALGAWTGPARLVRAEILSLRSRDFVDACRVLGMTPLRIAFVEVLPNALPPAVTLAAVIVANAVLVEAALSFLGLGDPNAVTWGGMIAEGRPVFRSAAYLSTIPGLAIVFTVLAVNLVGEAINDAISARRVQA
jgi:peptide/nickel transport system permease protein